MPAYTKILLCLAIFALVWIVTISYIISLKNQDEVYTGPKLPYVCTKVSLVYTWVNGSDPEHIQARTIRSGNNAFSSPGNNRFRDLGGLMYSLRSVEKFAPWIEDVYIVTSGQIPSYLDTKNPHVHIISHAEIFHNPSDLPTFSSNAIEASFHNLPDYVGDCFVYLNDDMFFANEVFPADFYTPDRGQILFQSLWTAPPPASRMGNIWHRSIDYSNQLLTRLWGNAAERHYASHGPYFFNLEVLRHLYNSFPIEFNATTAHPFRNEYDVSIPFLYHQFTLHYYTSVIADRSINLYIKIIDDYKRMRSEFRKILKRRPKTVCMNDGLGENPSEAVLKEMHTFFHELFPTKSKYERYEDSYM